MCCKKLISFLLLLLIIPAFNSCKNAEAVTPSEKQTFSFAFFTDLHLNNGNNNCFMGFQKAIESARSKEVDFIITGGDNCDIDVLGNDSKTANDLYSHFSSVIKSSGIQFYPALGNHDRYYGVSASDPLYNQGLFEKYMGVNSYYSFDHKGWHFIILNTANSFVDETQKSWLQKDLSLTPYGTPIILVVHVPFLSLYYPALYGNYTSKDTTKDFKKIWDMFSKHNLKLVLQGHMHIYEEIKVLDTQFITGGAISANWWAGPYFGTQEGYLKVDIDQSGNVSWSYIDYGWSVE